MKYKKQSDGRSWLVYKEQDGGERRLALVRIDPDVRPYCANVERLDATDAEVPDVELVAGKILKRFADSKLKVCIAAMSPHALGYAKRLAEVCGAKDSVILRSYDKRSSEEMFEILAKEMYWEEITESKTFSEVWLVADRECREMALFDKTLRAKFPSIHTAFTHPGFEYWLLLHDPNFDGMLPFDREEIVSADQTEERIGRRRFRKTIVCEIVRETSASACREVFAKRMPGYAAAPNKVPARLMAGLREALQKAREADPETADYYSEMPVLFERLCRLGRRKPEAVLCELEEAAKAPAPVASEPELEPESGSHPPTETPEAASAPEEKPETGAPPSSEPEPANSPPALTLPGRMEDVFARSFELTESWQKAPAALGLEERMAAMLMLDRLGDWGELEYRRLKNANPTFSAPMLADAGVLAEGDKEKAADCALRHICRLRCMLGSLVKNKFAMSAKSLLTYLAEIRLCRSWFKRCFDEAHDDPASDAAASAPAGNAPQAPSSQTEGSEYEPRPDTAFRTARIADDDGRQACRRTAEALKPFTTKKAFRLNPARTDAVCVDIDTAFQWAYEALYLKTQRSYVRRPSISAEIDRMGRFDTETTRASFVKACQSAIGALGNASENGSEVHEGTLQTVLDRLEIIREWLALDAAEQS